MTRTMGRALALALPGWLLAASPALAQQAGKHDRETKAREADERHPGEGGQSAAVDAQGKLRPLSADEAQELGAAMSRHVDQSSEGLQATDHPSGAVSVDLDDRFQNMTLARRGADGKVSTACVGSKAEADQFLRQGAAPAARSPAARPVTPRVTTPAPLEEK